MTMSIFIPCYQVCSHTTYLLQKDITTSKKVWLIYLFIFLVLFVKVARGIESFPVYCCCWVTQLCPTLCDPTECSMPGSSILHSLPEFAQTRVHWIRAIQPSHPLSSPSPPAFNLSQFLDDGELIYHKCIRHGLSLLLGRAESEDKMWLKWKDWKSASKPASLEHRFTWSFTPKFWWSFSFTSLTRY